MISWKEKFKHLCTPAGNLKRSITEQEAHSVFRYRLEEIGKVALVEFYERGSEKVQVKCIECGYVWRASGKKLLLGSGCPLCAGNTSEAAKLAALQTLGNIPKRLLEKCPAHVAIRGHTEGYRGVRWFDFSRIYDDLFYIIYNREFDYYSFMTCALNEFPDKVHAGLFVYGGDTAVDCVSKDYWDHMCYRSSGHWAPFEWAGGDNKNYTNIMWETPYASIIKYCLEKKFKARQYWPDPIEDPYAFRLKEEDLKLLSEVTDVEDILSWSMN